MFILATIKQSIVISIRKAVGSQYFDKEIHRNL